MLVLLLALACGGKPSAPADTAPAACPDGDGDGVCDADDRCLGDDATGDADGDHRCDDTDPCPTDNPDDLDGDGVCNGDDVCTGDDATGDTDGDGTCDDGDPCPLDDPDDTDLDGVCDADDLCQGEDDGVDSDADGVADGCDACPGEDDTADADGDGAPDACDACPGEDDTADLDADGQPDACDPCPEDNPDDADGDGVCDSTCRAWEEDCGLLPFRGDPSGSSFATGGCPDGWLAVGVRTYLSDTFGKAQLICREALDDGTLGELVLYSGGWGSGGDGPFDERCDDAEADGVIVGQRIWATTEVWGIGAICERLSDLTTGGGEHLETWPVGVSNVGDHTLREDLCPPSALVWSYDVRVDGDTLTAVAMRCGVP